jgi:hypothetical protein
MSSRQVSTFVEGGPRLRFVPFSEEEEEEEEEEDSFLETTVAYGDGGFEWVILNRARLGLSPINGDHPSSWLFIFPFFYYSLKNPCVPSAKNAWV